MGCCSSSVRICLLGNWEDKDDWKETFRFKIEQMREAFCQGLVFSFVETTPTARVEFFPHNLWNNITLDIRLAQEQFLASKSDIVVYINDGNWPGYKKKHLDCLEKKTGSLVLWTPDTIKKKEEFLKEEDRGGARPGVVAYDGNMKKLISIVLYLALSGEEQLHGS